MANSDCSGGESGSGRRERVYTA